MQKKNNFFFRLKNMEELSEYNNKLMICISKSKKFCKFHDSFKKNKSRENYNNFIEFLNKIYFNYFKNNHYKTSLTVSDESNTVVYNSNMKNTYKNYINNKICYDNEVQFNLSNVSEKNGSSCGKFKQQTGNNNYSTTIYNFRKIGSSIGNGITSDAITPGLNQE